MEFFDLLVIYFYSYVPAILLALFFWWMDRFERESFILVCAAFFWGAFGAGLLSYFWNSFFHIALDVYQKGNASTNDVIVSVIVAPFVEELTKGIVILLLLWLNKIDNVTDGILMGVVIGLGFAAAENVHYAQNVIYPNSGELAMWHNLWFREIHTTLLHASASAVWGAMIGYSRLLNYTERFFSWMIGFVLAMVTHGFWNFLASYVGRIRAPFNLVQILMRLELMLIFGSLITLYLVSLRRQSRVIIKELLEEHEAGLVPFEHIGFFASLVRHPKRYQLPAGISVTEYAHLGVRLAFRKNQDRFHSSAILRAEIERLRAQLKDVLMPPKSETQEDENEQP
ncbi:MAG: PrsW family intramembrane metalloprotease [Deltaproteobacteria bacterium]|nr:PrsW family intramembrane metalloprotease [Deltaproteobacteria bacterium]